MALEERQAVAPEPGSVFHYKYLLDVTGNGFQLEPTLVKVTFESRVHRYETETGSVSLAMTTHDPLGEIEVFEVLDASYAETDVTTRQENLATVDPEAFLPYAFGTGRVDDWLTLDDASASSSAV